LELDRINNKIDNMTPDEVVVDLKKQKLDSFGSHEMRIRRLKN
jgi:hypothetical protein